MYKKIITMISVLFVLSLITLGCSSKNNSTSPIIKNDGLKSYAGTWRTQLSDPDFDYDLIIGADGSVKISNDYAYDIKDLGSDKYSMDVFSGTYFTITLTFSSKNSGTISDSLLGEGTITKRN